MCATETRIDSKEKIIIDLFAPNVPGSTEDKDFIQRTLRDQLVNSIRESLKAAAEDKPSELERFVDESGRNVYFVDGTRGAGKTTFINRVVEHLQKKEQGEDSIECLPPIDPTKLPRSEPILVTVTARLNYVVSKKFKGCWSSDKNKPNKEKWQQQLQQLERGLRLLNDKEYKPEYFSEALQLNAQLEYSMGGQDLSAIFGTLVELACDILECKAILISFDDIDT